MGRSRSEIRADIDQLAPADRVVFDRAASTGERPDDEPVAALAAEWIGHLVSSAPVAFLVVVLVGPLGLLGFLWFGEADVSVSTAVAITSPTAGAVGLIVWATAYRPIRRREVTLCGGSPPSRTLEKWVIGALTAWVMAFIIGGVVSALGVRVPPVLGWPLWIVLTYGCKKALDGRDDGDTW